MRDYDELVKRLREHNGWALNETLDQAADAIEDLIDALTASNEVIAKSRDKWISVEERLPDKDADVLIYGEWIGASGTKYREIYLTNIKEFRYHGYKPIAWMPLPEQPEEADNA